MPLVKGVRMLAVAAVLGAGAASAAQDPGTGSDWSAAVSHFDVGAETADALYTRRTAAICLGRWRLHADAVDDGAFPPGVPEAWPEELQLYGAIQAAEFFILEVQDPIAKRTAEDEAEDRLNRALAGDAEAFRLYFEALGRCTSAPEEARDYPGDADEMEAEGPAEAAADSGAD